MDRKNTLVVSIATTIVLVCVMLPLIVMGYHNDRNTTNRRAEVKVRSIELCMGSSDPDSCVFHVTESLKRIK